MIHQFGVSLDWKPCWGCHAHHLNAFSHQEPSATDCLVLNLGLQHFLNSHLEQLDTLFDVHV